MASVSCKNLTYCGIISARGDFLLSQGYMSRISNTIMSQVTVFITWLKSHYFEKYQFELCSKYDREHNFDVNLGQVVLCRKLRWICRKHSNDVVQQFETPGKSTVFVT